MIQIDLQEEFIKLGNRIKKFRIKKGLTQSELANAMEEEPQYIADLEAGSGNIRVTEIGQLTQILGIRMSEFFSE